MYYRGEFKARNGGRYIVAEIHIYTEKTGDPSALVLDADPLMLSWDECTIDKSIHKAQAEVRVIATADRMYRDITESLEPVYMQLYLDGSLWWRGQYASSTCLEPFSTEKNYRISLTFSDFNTLARIAYDGSYANAAGLVTVGEILSLALRQVSSGGITVHPVIASTIGETSFMNLIVRDAMLYDSYGEPRYLLDVLTDILESANVHMMQYGGSVHLFSTDYFTYITDPLTVSRSMRAGSTDAEMETCESYSRMELDYSRGEDDMYSFSPDMNGYTYSGDYADISDDGDASEILALGDQVVAPGTYLAISGGDSSSASMILLMKTGLYWPGGTVPVTPESVADISYDLPQVTFCISQDQVKAPTASAHRIKLTLSLFMYMLHEAGEDYGLLRASVGAKVRFVSMTGASKYLKENTSIFSKSRYSWEGDSSTQVSLFLSNEQPDKNKRGTLSLSIYIPDPQDTGKIYVDMDIRTLTLTDTDRPLGESGIKYATPVLKALGLVGISASPDGYLDMSILSTMDAVKEDLADTSDETYSRSFAMGTPITVSVDTHSNFIGYGIVNKSSTFLSRYAAFVRKNMARKEGEPPRRTVTGTYMFDHLAGLPIFSPDESVPLKTLAGLSRGFFMRSEQWNVRTGMSNICIEEADVKEYEPYPGARYAIASPSELRFPGAGGTQNLRIISNIIWALVAGDHISISPNSGTSSTDVAVKMDINTTLTSRTSTLKLNAPQNPGGSTMINIIQEAGEAFLEISSSGGLVPWGTQPPQVGISTNMDEIVLSSNSPYAEPSLDGLILNINVKETPGGRNSLPVPAAVIVTGKAEGYPDISRNYAMIIGAPGFRLDTMVQSANVPQAGGAAASYYVEFRSNGSSLSISLSGSLASYNTFWLYRRTGQNSYQSVKALSEGDTSYYPSGDPGAEEMQYYRIYPWNAYPANADGGLLAAAFIVTANAPGQTSKTTTLVISQNAQ